MQLWYTMQQQVSPDEWELLQDVTYYPEMQVKIDGEQVANITIKKGIVYDGASKLFLKRFGRYTLAALLHDGLYASELVSRRKADALFKEAMVSLGVETWRVWLYWSTVRVLGWWKYRQHTAESIAVARKYVTWKG